MRTEAANQRLEIAISPRKRAQPRALRLRLLVKALHALASQTRLDTAEDSTQYGTYRAHVAQLGLAAHDISAAAGGRGPLHGDGTPKRRCASPATPPPTVQVQVEKWRRLNFGRAGP